MLYKNLNKKSKPKFMRRINLLMYIIILITYITGCETSNDNDIIDLKDIKTKNIKISSIADSVYYIPLETKEKCVIKSIDEIKITDDRIFILNNRKTILIFNKTGEFMNKIDNRGKGPGEYRIISSFSVNPAKDIVYILDDHKILGYDYWGNYQHYKIKVNNYNAFHFHNNLFYCHAPVELHSKDKQNKLDVIDLKGSKINSYLPVKKENKGISKFITFAEFYTMNNKVFLLEPEENVLYKVDTNSITPKYQLIYESNENAENKLEAKLALESPNIILFSYAIGNKWNLLYVNKNNNNKVNVKTNEDIGFENDIFYDTPIAPQFIEGNLLIERVYPHNLIEYIKEDKSKYEDYIDIKNLSEEDNPILRITHLNL